ncbi:hypothetical protein F8M41_012536 [Gigaspora margarita]|uniref:Uncharacterized protein n=1 Tax=Gigaspora margarita TaxID=4874 RepID=A0A8H4ASZ1_GIGMA|nr:hypothetical protein F8M41_012536 [Gigaspora margarita]
MEKIDPEIVDENVTNLDGKFVHGAIQNGAPEEEKWKDCVNAGQQLDHSMAKSHIDALFLSYGRYYQMFKIV